MKRESEAKRKDYMKEKDWWRVWRSNLFIIQTTHAFWVYTFILFGTFTLSDTMMNFLHYITFNHAQFHQDRNEFRFVLRSPFWHLNTLLNDRSTCWPAVQRSIPLNHAPSWHVGTHAVCVYFKENTCITFLNWKHRCVTFNFTALSCYTRIKGQFLLPI